MLESGADVAAALSEALNAAEGGAEPGPCDDGTAWPAACGMVLSFGVSVCTTPVRRTARSGRRASLAQQEVVDQARRAQAHSHGRQRARFSDHKFTQRLGAGDADVINLDVGLSL